VNKNKGHRRKRIMKTIGFIGVGVMGKSMVRNLMKNGYDVSIYTRTKEKVVDIIEEGAKWCNDVKGCVEYKDAIISIVGYPKDVEEIYFGSDGILENCKEGSCVIDMTTTSPKLSMKIYNEAKKRNIYALDAPVSGGDVGAKNGTLSIMVGGELEIFDKHKDILSALGTNIIYEGKAGNGQHTKMANQIALAGAIAGVCEAITYAKGADLDVQTMLDSISEGAAGSWQMKNMAPRILQGDFKPGFYIKHFIKDMNLAVEESSDNSIKLGILNEVLKMYKILDDNNWGDLGTQGLIKYYEGYNETN
jgi:3-hydroxyisobutyrate dehydrogenase-like beta-hydroxyacid dehydrogenase